MYMTDGKRTISITMHTWQGCDWSPDWSDDFFEAGSLERVDNDYICIVDDLDYCIEQAHDWENKLGDYRDDGIPDPEDRAVFIEEIKE